MSLTPASQTSRTPPALVRINVDGADYDVAAGSNLIEAARSIGKEIPHFCYHSKLSVSGNCRMCLVETGAPERDRATGAPVQDETGKPKISWSPKPAAACATTVSPGLHVRLGSPLVKSCREGILEFILLNHPLDCPVCDQAGECRLQDYAFAHGRGYSRYECEKNRKPKRTRIGPRVHFDAERCILCSRCVRFCREVARNPVLGFIRRGSRNELACFPGTELDGNYSLNTVDLCPVGALTDSGFRFQSRVWFLKQTPSICPESSVGVNTTLWHRDGKILRVTPRHNNAVNDSWMPDSGRELHHAASASNRMVEHLRDGVAVPAAAALAAATALLRSNAGKTAYIASGHLSLEEQALAARLVHAFPGPVYLPRHPGENDGLLLSEERSPNTRGALLTGLFDRTPDASLAPLVPALESGEIKLLVVLREDITTLEIPPELIKKSRVKIIHLTTCADETSARASVVFPALFTFEKDGAYVNEQFRLQKFHRAVPGPDAVPSEIVTLRRLLDLAQQPDPDAPVPATTTPAQAHAEIWDTLSAAPGPLAGITFDAIPPDGLLLDAAAWQHLPFPETHSLHYAPHAG
jgi:NADH-quinone oxidoreductase subunit G